MIIMGYLVIGAEWQLCYHHLPEGMVRLVHVVPKDECPHGLIVLSGQTGITAIFEKSEKKNWLKQSRLRIKVDV